MVSSRRQSRSVAEHTGCLRPHRGQDGINLDDGSPDSPSERSLYQHPLVEPGAERQPRRWVHGRRLAQESEPLQVPAPPFARPVLPAPRPRVGAERCSIKMVYGAVGRRWVWRTENTGLSHGRWSGSTSSRSTARRSFLTSSVYAGHQVAQERCLTRAWRSIDSQQAAIPGVGEREVYGSLLE